MAGESGVSSLEGNPAAVEKRQALRLRRFYMAAATYPLVLMVAVIASKQGLWHMSRVQWIGFIGAALMANGVLWWLFKSGHNRYFRDASLTREQILFAAIWGLVPLYAIPDVRASILMFYMVPFSFGMLRLSRRQFLQVVAIVMSLYGSMLLVEQSWRRSSFDAGHELFLFLMFGALLTWFALFGGFVNDLREKLKAKNRALEIANARIASISVTDELTRLHNRRHAFEVMRQVHADAQAGQSTYTLAILDIDHFKSVNDTWGHQVGDQVLTDFAVIVAEGLRAHDLLLAQPPDGQDATTDGGFLARYGGEEFILVFSNTTEAQAATCLNRMREHVKAFAFAGDREIHISFSGGVAAYRSGDSLEKVISRADRSLYRAKSQGRDQVAMDQDHRREAVDALAPGGSVES